MGSAHATSHILPLSTGNRNTQNQYVASAPALPTGQSGAGMLIYILKETYYYYCLFLFCYPLQSSPQFSLFFTDVFKPSHLISGYALCNCFCHLLRMIVFSTDSSSQIPRNFFLGIRSGQYIPKILLRHLFTKVLMVVMLL